jgi:hypothetical protein
MITEMLCVTKRRGCGLKLAGGSGGMEMEGTPSSLTVYGLEGSA